jgi:hypothetical protein
LPQVRSGLPHPGVTLSCRNVGVIIFDHEPLKACDKCLGFFVWMPSDGAECWMPVLSVRDVPRSASLSDVVKLLQIAKNPLSFLPCVESVFRLVRARNVL